MSICDKSNCSEEGKLQEETWKMKTLKRKPSRISFTTKLSRKLSLNKNVSKAQTESKKTTEKLEAEGNVAFPSFRKNIIKNQSFNTNG